LTRTLALRLEARDEIDEAFTWFEEQRVGLGHEFLDDLRECLELIRAKPEWYAVLYRGIRAKPFRRFPYVVYFRASDKRVDVVAVQHGHRNPRGWRWRS
jgi:plasmid stabilization system protein ParE